MFSLAVKQINSSRCLSPYHQSSFGIHILAESNDFIAVDKPFGMFSQGGTNVNSNNNIIEATTKFRQANQVYSVHRLDRDTSGVMIFAKSKAMAQHLSDQFSNGQIKKVYHAITLGIPAMATSMVDEPLVEVKHGSMMRVCVDRINGKPAKTHFQIKQANPTLNLALIELRPSTGRKHQLRAHCAFLNCPILGDVKYGGLVINKQNQRKYLQDCGVIIGNYKCRLMLHASWLSFVDLQGEEHVIQADQPREFRVIARTMTPR